MFLEEEAFDAAVKAEEENAEIPVAVLTRLLRQQGGQQLFQAEAQNAKWLAFLETTQAAAGLDSLGLGREGPWQLFRGRQE